MKTFLIGILFSFSNLVFAEDYKFIDIQDGSLAYRSFGEGEPLLLLNGGPGRSSDSFAELAETISLNQRQVIIFDQRGTGRSQLHEVNEATITLAKMLDDIEKLRRHLKVEKFFIMGHSFGGMYAMAYAAEFPHRVGGLILSAPGGMDFEFQSYTRANMLSRLSKEGRANFAFWTSREQQQKDPVKASLESLRSLLPGA